MKKKIIAACIAAIVIIGGPTALATSASADDSTPVATATATPTPDPSATTDAPAAPVVTPAPTDTTAPVAAFVAAATAQINTTSLPAPTAYFAVSWDIAGGDASNPWAAPGQSLATHTLVSTIDLAALEASDPVACGANAKQYDIYKDSATTIGLLNLAEAGTKLTAPNTPNEDLVPGGSGVAYAVVQGATCPPPPPPAAIACTVTGPSYAEDVKATSTATGDFYSGQSSPVEQYFPVTGNLQGLGTQSLTFADVAGYQPSLTIVLNPNGVIPTSLGGDGTTVKHYLNLVSEWYENGGAPSTDGTFTITPASLYWTNKIPTGNAGSITSPQPLSFFIALWPNNAFTPATGAGAIGGHLGSGQTDATHSTITAETGCVNFVAPVKPADTTREASVTTNDCSVNVATTITTDYSTPYVWDATSASYVLGTEVVTGTTTTTAALNSDQIAEDCTTLVIAPPTSTDQCTGGTVVTPAVEPDGIKYTLLADGSRPTAGVDITVAAGDSLTIQAHTLASLGAGFEQESQSWTYTGAAAVTQSTDASAPCYVAPPTTPITPKTVLAFTGGTIAWFGFVLAGGMLFLGIAFLLIRRRKVA